MNIADYVVGLQHIGIPTKDIEASVEFFSTIGFREMYRTRSGEMPVVFLQQQGIVIEIWLWDAPGRSGAIDHLALEVTDIEAAFQSVGAAGLPVIGGKINELPFWERGVRYFLVEGPNAEKVEFIQKL